MLASATYGGTIQAIARSPHIVLVCEGECYAMTSAMDGSAISPTAHYHRNHCT
jgi:hypothetical protein